MTDNKYTNHTIRNNHGSILVIVMMGVIVMMVVVGMMFYVKNSTDALSYIMTKGSTREMTEDVIGNILETYSQPLVASTCDSQLVAAAVSFRDFSNANPAVYTLDTNSSNASPPPAVSAKACLIPEAMANQLERAIITLTPMPTADDLHATRRELRIEIRLQKKGAVTGQTVIRHYVFNLVSLDRYGVIFNSSQSTAFVLENSSHVVFDSLVLHSNKATAFPINSLVGYTGSPAVIFKQQFLTLADNISTTTGFSYAKFNSVFEKGVTVRHLANASKFPTTNASNSWVEPIDYQYVYSNAGEVQDLSALPRLTGGKTSTNGDGHRYNNALANETSFPNDAIIRKLAHTCDIGISGSAISKIMVLYRADAEVTLDFASDSDPFKFCGMLRVKKLTLKTQVDKVYYLFGKYYFDELKVTGGGTVYFIDPELDTALSQSYDGIINMNELRRELKTLEVYVGNPFFQPITKDPASIHPNYVHKLPSSWFSGAEQKDLAGNTIGPASETCDSAYPGDYCWPNYMRSYRRHIEGSGKPNISVLFNAAESYNRTLIFAVSRTL